MDAGGPFLAGQREREVAVNGAARQGAILVTEIEKVRIGERIQVRFAFLPRIGHADSDELVRLRERQRF